MSPFEIVGTVLGIVGVGLMIRQNIWGWPIGLVQVAVYAWIFFEAKLYSDAILQAFFFAIQAYGWGHWIRGQKSEVRGQRSEDVGRKPEAGSRRAEAGGQRSEVRGQRSDGGGLGAEARAGSDGEVGDGRVALPVTRLSGRALAGWAVAGAAGTAAWGELMRRETDAALPHWDAFILVFSLIAQWLQARKRLECWAGWMIVNVVGIGVYWAKDLRLTAGLYVVFFAMAVAGHVEWRKSLREAGEESRMDANGRERRERA